MMPLLFNLGDEQQNRAITSRDAPWAKLALIASPKAARPLRRHETQTINFRSIDCAIEFVLLLLARSLTVCA
jgi:hypothetical protein